MLAISDDGLLGLIDLIYSATLDPTAWSAVLRRLAQYTGCIAGGLTIEEPSTGIGRPLTFFGFDPDHVRRTFAHFLPMNPLFAIEARMRPGFVVTNEMVVRTEQFRKTDFYDGWARPQGLCSPLSLVLHREAARYVPLTLVRPDGAGEASEESVRLLKALSPHLVRAMDLSLRLARQDARSLALETGLDQLGIGVILLDSAGRPVHVNPVADATLRDGRTLTIRNGVLCETRTVAGGHFRRLLAGARSGRAGRAGEAVLRRADGVDLLISVIPLSPDLNPISDIEAAAMVVIRTADGARAKGLAGFATRHDLTAREREVMEAIVLQGATLPAAAERLGIRLTTAKTHLQRIFEKTGSNRQAELVAKGLQSLFVS